MTQAPKLTRLARTDDPLPALQATQAALMPQLQQSLRPGQSLGRHMLTMSDCNNSLHNFYNAARWRIWIACCILRRVSGVIVGRIGAFGREHLAFTSFNIKKLQWVTMNK